MKNEPRRKCPACKKQVTNAALYQQDVPFYRDTKNPKQVLCIIIMCDNCGCLFNGD